MNWIVRSLYLFTIFRFLHRVRNPQSLYLCQDSRNSGCVITYFKWSQALGVLGPACKACCETATVPLKRCTWERQSRTPQPDPPSPQESHLQSGWLHFNFISTAQPSRSVPLIEVADLSSVPPQSKKISLHLTAVLKRPRKKTHPIYLKKLKQKLKRYQCDWHEYKCKRVNEHKYRLRSRPRVLLQILWFFFLIYTITG